MSTTQGRYSHMIGNKNAKKYSKPLDASLSLRCNSTDKYHWMLEAQRSGLSLNQWVIEKLNLSIDKVV